GDTHLFGSSCKQIGVALSSDIGKVEREGDITSIGVDAATVEIGRCSYILFDDAQNPALVRAFLLLWFLQCLAPFGRETVQGQALTIEDGALLREEVRVQVEQLGKG